jgi:putative membrane protein
MSMPSFHNRPVTLLGAALACVALVACKPSGDAAADSATSDTLAAAVAPASDTTATSAKPNDAQIAHIAVTANSIDSASGELAKSKAQSKAVKDFAQTMITDHTQVNKQAVALATKLGVTPEDNDVSRQLQSGAETSQASLKTKSGADFDSAYIDHEVAFHQAVLDALDSTLIPDAQNAELKGLLTKVRPAIAAHLERAKGIQKSLTSGS